MAAQGGDAGQAAGTDRGVGSVLFDARGRGRIGRLAGGILAGAGESPARTCSSPCVPGAQGVQKGGSAGRETGFRPPGTTKGRWSAASCRWRRTAWAAALIARPFPAPSCCVRPPWSQGRRGGRPDGDRAGPGAAPAVSGSGGIGLEGGRRGRARDTSGSVAVSIHRRRWAARRPNGLLGQGRRSLPSAGATGPVGPSGRQRRAGTDGARRAPREAGRSPGPVRAAPFSGAVRGTGCQGVRGGHRGDAQAGQCGPPGP